MIEERRNAVYLFTRRKHGIDISNFEGQPWKQNIDGSWTRYSIVTRKPANEQIKMTVNELGVRLHSNSISIMYGV